MKSFNVIDKIYGFKYIVVYDCSEKEACNKFKKTHPHSKIDFDNSVGVFHHLTDCDCRLLYFREKNDYGVIAHECFHASIVGLAECGVDFYQGESNESFAYYMEWLVNEVIKGMK